MVAVVFIKSKEFISYERVRILFPFLFSLGMIHNLVDFFIDTICCRFKLGVYKPKQVCYI